MHAGLLPTVICAKGYAQVNSGSEGRLSRRGSSSGVHGACPVPKGIVLRGEQRVSFVRLAAFGEE